MPTEHDSYSAPSTSRRPPTVALFGVFGAGNLGNESTLQAMIANLRCRWKAIHIRCICHGPDEAIRHYNIQAFPIRTLAMPNIHSRIPRIILKALLCLPIELCRWANAVRRLRDCDLLIMTGTGMLSDLGIRPLGLHFDIVRWAVAARLCRSKVIFVSVGAGPIRHPLSRLLVKLALSLAHYRSYRDTFGKRYLHEIGFDSEADHVYPDLAFSLPIAGQFRTSQSNSCATVVGVGIITHTFKRSPLSLGISPYENYINNLAAFIAWLMKHNYKVRILIGDVRYDEKARKDLLVQLKKQHPSMPRSELILDEPAESVAELLSQISSTDIVVGSRFHNVLLALTMGKPVIAISFHDKVDALMAEVGWSRFCQDIENIDIERLIAQLRDVERNASTLKVEIESRSRAYRTALAAQYDKICQDFLVPRGDGPNLHRG